MPELVTVTIDDRSVKVPKGTGLVETAAAAGIEIPVFCYEPRLGPAVGACRMCLVEIEGLPKLQAGCTLGAQDGMVVHTAATSEKAAEGQNATLEFILVNHPLDCPVCDKGGECPLQDLTFRYGPGNTRMTFPKLTLEKPIPISPTIALDRERCILCYRCTRFSSDVAEDNQLIARNRGAHSEIATFAADPYRAPFSGNVIELCPVGALTSTQYRFEARPWDIQSVPDRLRPLPGRVQRHCHRSAKARSSASSRATIPRWTAAGCATRAGSPTPTCRPPIASPSRSPVAALGLEPIAWDDALDRIEALLRGCRGPDRHRSLGIGDARAGVRPRPAPAQRPRRPFGRAARVDLVSRSTRSVCRCRRSPTPRSSSSSATTRWPTARLSSSSGSRPPHGTAPRSSMSVPTGSVKSQPGGGAAR